jgi:hypothetical protein
MARWVPRARGRARWRARCEGGRSHRAEGGDSGADHATSHAVGVQGCVKALRRGWGAGRPGRGRETLARRGSRPRPRWPLCVFAGDRAGGGSSLAARAAARFSEALAENSRAATSPRAGPQAAPLAPRQPAGRAVEPFRPRQLLPRLHRLSISASQPPPPWLTSRRLAESPLEQAAPLARAAPATPWPPSSCPRHPKPPTITNNNTRAVNKRARTPIAVRGPDRASDASRKWNHKTCMLRFC